jgi:hypothetical protein
LELAARSYELRIGILEARRACLRRGRRLSDVDAVPALAFVDRRGRPGCRIGRAGAFAADFYQGKTLTVIVGYAPGGGVDTTARAVTRHLGRFIPGNPAVTVQNMEGGAGIVSVNHRPHRDRDQDLRRAESLGEDASFGALGAGSHTATVPNLLAAAGAPIRVVLGYVSTARILLALEQGEVDGSFTTGDGLASRAALAKQVVPIVQSAARYPGLPLLRNVIREQHRPVLDLVMATDTFGVPIVGPPGMAAEQTAILRKAFLAMAQDQDYQADARRVELPVGSPIEGGRLAEMMRTLAAATTSDVISEFQKLASGK